MFRSIVLAIAVVSLCPALIAQQTLNNESVIKLVKAGLTDDLILSTVNASPGAYDTSADGLIALKTAGVSDKVVAALVVRASAPTPGAQPTAAPPSTAVFASGISASQNSSPTVQAPAPQPPPPPFHSADGKVRVYVTDHPIFESNGIAKAAGDRHGASAAAVSHTQAGDDPRTVEIEADILKVCPIYIVASNNPDRSDLVLVFRRRGGSRSSMFAFGGLTGLALSGAMKVDGASLFQADGDMVYATKQSTVEKAIKDVCAHIAPPTVAQASTPGPSLSAK